MTAARFAVWDAIDNASSLDGVFHTKIRHNGSEPAWDVLRAAPADFPSIEIGPTGTSTLSPYTEARLDAPYPLEVVVLAAEYDLAFYETVAADVVAALHQTAGPSGVPYVKDATGHPPELKSTAVRRVPRGEGDALMAIAIRVDLRVRLPF
ncbi:MAG: hypothetical protein AAGJ97_03115 [Planctomycetota bacterium]